MGHDLRSGVNRRHCLEVCHLGLPTFSRCLGLAGAGDGLNQRFRSLRGFSRCVFGDRCSTSCTSLAPSRDAQQWRQRTFLARFSFLQSGHTLYICTCPYHSGSLT
jgi:hypothetical protein